MINFIICSNNYEKQKETKEVIVKYMMNYDIDYKYHIFNNDYEVKNNKISGYNVYLIDIINNDSINLVKYIREELDDWNSIIILMSDNQVIDNIYGKRLFLFDIIYHNKSFNKILIEDLNRIIKNYDHREKCLTFEANRVVKKVDFKSIIMINKEKDSKKCLLTSSYGEYYVPETLSGISKRLDNRFIKTNRSCIVNKDQIIEYDSNKNKITFKNGIVSFNISREQKKNISNYVTKY